MGMCGRFGLDLDDDMYRTHKSGALYLRGLEDEAWRQARSFDARPSTRRGVIMPAAGGPALAWARWGWRPTAVDEGPADQRALGVRPRPGDLQGRGAQPLLRHPGDLL
jgi:putative SOS response-associated peptidase YedK